MDTDYDRIAEQYQRARLRPWRAHIERYTLLRLVGDVVGKAVIDLACGEGYYTRALRQQGAARIVGVDLSRAMIGLAEAEEARRPLGVEYRVGTSGRWRCPGSSTWPSRRTCSTTPTRPRSWRRCVGRWPAR